LNLLRDCTARSRGRRLGSGNATETLTLAIERVKVIETLKETRIRMAEGAASVE
jgi:hypothetical protein